MSDAYSVVYSPEAKADLREIYTYIAFDLQSPGTAEGQVNRIRKEIRSLDFMPSRYSIVDWEPWKSMGMHKVPVDNFVVYYSVNTENKYKPLNEVEMLQGADNMPGKWQLLIFLGQQTILNMQKNNTEAQERSCCQ